MKSIYSSESTHKVSRSNNNLLPGTRTPGLIGLRFPVTLRISYEQNLWVCGENTSLIKYKLSSIHIKHQISVIKYHTSSIIYQVSDIIYRISCIRYQVLYIKYQVSYINYQISIIRYQVSSMK